MGFSTLFQLVLTGEGLVTSQSLSGWDGVFDQFEFLELINSMLSQSLSGWDGVFNKCALST